MSAAVVDLLRAADVALMDEGLPQSHPARAALIEALLLLLPDHNAEAARLAEHLAARHGRVTALDAGPQPWRHEENLLLAARLCGECAR